MQGLTNVSIVETLSLPAREESPRAAVDTLKGLVGGDLTKVNTLILERMQSPVTLIPTLAGHLIHSGGKRLRPLLTLAAARMCGYPGLNHVKLAATVEFIHTATLLHDDVVDESDLRRGQDTANVLWGNQASVLVGDFLFSRAFELMVETGNLRVLGILSGASAVIAEGEVLQLSTTNDLATGEETYLEVISSKTAALFEAATHVGAVIAGAPSEQEEALRMFGRHLGVAFQLVDDALDYSGERAELGKTIGDDFREGKITLPVILAHQDANETDRAFWRRTIEELDQSPDDLSRAIRLINETNALDRSLERAKAYGEEALQALDVLPDDPIKDALAGVVDFCISRTY